jgi:hypothetical protein
MKLSRDEAELYIPDGAPEAEALARTTHLAVGAHQDDLEIMAAHGILACYDDPDQWFTGVTVTNGAGTPRSGAFADYTNDEMVEARKMVSISAMAGEPLTCFTSALGCASRNCTAYRPSAAASRCSRLRASTISSFV